MAKYTLLIFLMASVLTLAYATPPEQFNIIEGPVQCPPGHKPDANGDCREEWGRVLSSLQNDEAVPPRTLFSIVQVPPSCPPGQKPDQSGKCRPVFQFATLQAFLQRLASKA